MESQQEKTLTSLRTAIQMEIDGKSYYQQVSQTSGHEAGRKLFNSLAQEEDVHLEKFKQIYSAIESRQTWPEIKLGSTSHGISAGIFDQTPAGNKGATSTELKSIEKAMQMETKTREYYLEQASKAVYPVQKEFLKEVAEQERIHHAVLYDYFEYRKDPAQWFTMKERHSLDGG